MEQAEQARIRYDAAKNELESYIYKAKDFWTGDSAIEAVDDAEIQAILQETDRAEDWLDDITPDVTYEMLGAKLTE